MKLPKYVHAYVDRLGKPRFYYRRKGAKRVPLPGLPWSPDFMTAYAAAEASQAKPAPPGPIGASRVVPGSLKAALVRYYASTNFTQGLAESSQGAVCNLLERFAAAEGRGERRLHDMQHRHLQAAISKFKFASVQRNMLRSIRHFLKWALDAGMIDNNPSDGVRRKKLRDTGGHRIWTEEHVAQFKERHPVGSQAWLALCLMLNLGVRISDARQIGPQNIRDGVLSDYQPQKGRRTGGKLIDVPVLPKLAEAIAATPVIGTKTFLVTAFGKPFASPRRSATRWPTGVSRPTCHR